MSRRLDHVRRWAGGALVAAVLAIGMSTAAQKPVVDPLRAGPLPAPKVKVNKTTPKVAPPRTTLSFSARPTAAEIFAARAFKEPIVPVGGTPSDAETAALAQTLVAYTQGPGAGSVEPFQAFLAAHPATPWRASIQLNLGGRYRAGGAWARALKAWENAWTLAKDGDDPHARAVADLAMGEWLLLNAQLGRAALVRERAAELGGRPMGGPAAVKIGEAREIAAITTRHPDKVVSSGPQALQTVLEQLKVSVPSALTNFRPTAAGVSLLQLRDLSRASSAPMRMVRRVSGTDVPVPSIVHWKVNHYAAIVEQQGEQFRIVDRGMGGTYWLSRELLLEEASGYFLLPQQANVSKLPEWADVDDSTGASVVGFSCPPGGPPPNEPPECPPCGGGGFGMVTYEFHPVTASLRLLDTPLGYSPPRGPRIHVRLTYHQRDALQSQIFTSAHVGRKWMTDWFRYLQEEPADVFGINPPHVWVLMVGGGREVATGPTAGVYPADWRTKATIVKVSESPLRYERRLRDGTVEVFAAPNSAPAGQRRIYLTQIIDPQLQSVTLTWDSQYRLVAITDAIGQVTTLAYNDGADPLRLTSITDPFARTATLTYNAAGQLESITDVIGIVSRMAYGSEDFVSALTTPYGTTTFRREHLDEFVNRFVEATDPLGGTERIEFRWQSSEIPATEAASEVPTGFGSHNADLDDFNTVYWDKLAWARDPGDVTAATITRWLVASELPALPAYSTSVPHSVKRALASRVWYAYADQPAPGTAGSWAAPTRIARVVDDGGSQVWQRSYNTHGSVLTKTDPLARQTSYTYAANNIDVLTVRQTSGAMNDQLETYSNYVNHRPGTIADAAAQTTTFTYNSAGQVLTITNAKNETTTNAYDSDGRLESVTGPVAGSTRTFTFDAYGRPRTVTDAGSGALTVDYDSLDRVTRTTYPDSTYEEAAYARLDVASRRDRLGRVTRLYHDPLGRLTATRDPSGRLTVQEWCACGTLDAVVDARGNRTSWERDIRGRATREVGPDGFTDKLYTYGARTGRPLTFTDPKGQIRTYSYALDDQLLATVFSNAAVATPSVTFTYDAAYGRVTTMVDGIGITTYGYHPVGGLGAGSLASIDGPLADDTITYGYNELGVVTSRTVNGADTVTWVFDSLGRPTTQTTALGAFTYAYDGHTSRLTSLTYPNGQTSSYSYYSSSEDNRLQTIHHKYPNSATLSKFDYSYDAVGNVLSWRQQADTAAVLWEYAYDAVDQMTGAVKKSTTAPSTIMQRFGYAYDPSGNRTAEQIDDTVTGASYDPFNRLAGQQPAGPVVFAGTLSEPATVTVQGLPAAVGADNTFRGNVPLTAGANTVTINAVDASGNTATKQYELTSSGPSRTFSYDANGNMSADGTRTFEWDAADRLVKVSAGGSELVRYKYNGLGTKAEATEGILIRKYVTADFHVVEERLSTGGTIRHYHSLGIDRVLGRINTDGSTVYMVGDHLGSVVAETSPAGVSLLKREYDPFGRLTSGSASSGPAYTGRDWSAVTESYDYRLRVYDPVVAVFASSDPLGFNGGMNFYSYVRGNPLKFSDPFGLTVYECHRPMQLIGMNVSSVPHGLLWSTKCKQSYSFGPRWPTISGPGHIKTDDDPMDPDGKDGKKTKDNYTCYVVSEEECFEKCICDRIATDEKTPPYYSTASKWNGGNMCTDQMVNVKITCQNECRGKK